MVLADHEVNRPLRGLSSSARQAVAELHADGGKMIVSSREVICLYWAAEGKSFRDIALIEGATLEEIAVQFAEIMARLRAKTLAEAIEKARLIELI